MIPACLVIRENPVDLVTAMAPRFKKPKSPLGSYEFTGGTTLYKIEINEGQFGRVDLTESAGVKITSNNPKVVPMDDPVFRQTNIGQGVTQIEFFGLSGADTSMLEARRDGNVVTVLQIHVRSINGKRAFFQLAEPQMALHAPDTPVHYKLKYSATISWSMTPDDIGELVAKKGSMKHLVLSSHGSGDPKDGVFLNLGRGFRDQNDFNQFGMRVLEPV
jgi:hypothetical protein